MSPTSIRTLPVALALVGLSAATALANGHHGRAVGETVYVAPAETVYLAPAATTFLESSYVVPTTFVESSYVVPTSYRYVDVVPTSYVVPYRPTRYVRTRWVDEPVIYPTYYLATPTTWVSTGYTSAVETVYTPCAEPARVRTGVPQAGPAVSSRVQQGQGGATSGTSKPQQGANGQGAEPGGGVNEGPAAPKPGEIPGAPGPEGLGMNERERVRVAAKPAASWPVLEIRVVDGASRQPLEKFRVVATSATKNFEDREGTTDALGRAALRLPPGDWVVKVARSRGGEPTEALRVAAAPGQVATDDGRDLTATGFEVSR
ncbi:MAG TPA: hypothetical protein VG406_05490 [Isosphaeraceae bacterium]|jgi:hypothetical protein|nr:hypothetical protein [Isosphaeraceae bacterium]